MESAYGSFKRPHCSVSVTMVIVALNLATHSVALLCVYYCCFCHMWCTGCRECSRFCHQCWLEALPAHREASHWWLSEHCLHWHLQQVLPELPLPRDLHTVTSWRSYNFSIWSVCLADKLNSIWKHQEGLMPICTLLLYPPMLSEKQPHFKMLFMCVLSCSI